MIADKSNHNLQHVINIIQTLCDCVIAHEESTYDGHRFINPRVYIWNRGEGVRKIFEAFGLSIFHTFDFAENLGTNDF